MIGWEGQGIDCDMGEGCDWLVGLREWDEAGGGARLRFEDEDGEDGDGRITTVMIVIIRRKSRIFVTVSSLFNAINIWVYLLLL